MEIGDRVFSGKGAREAAAMASTQAVLAGSEDPALKARGLFRGFEILSRGRPRRVVFGSDEEALPELLIRGAGFYSVQLNAENPVGTMQSIKHAPRALDKRMAHETARLVRYEKMLADNQEQLGKPFEHEARLKELLTKQAELNAALDLDKGEQQVAPSVPGDPEGSEHSPGPEPFTHAETLSPARERTGRHGKAARRRSGGVSARHRRCGRDCNEFVIREMIMSVAAIRTVVICRPNMQVTYYIAAGFEWSAGDTVSNEMFSNAPRKTFFLSALPNEYASNLDYLARRTTELKLEELRVRAYNGLPSRRTAMFLYKREEDARKWLQRGPSRSGYHIYELNPARTEGAFETNYIWYNYLVRLHKDTVKENRKLFSEDIAIEIATCLTAYWTNRATEEFRSPSEVEVLFAGELNVVRKIE